MTNFSALGLVEPLCRALADEGYETPTPIQAQAIPELLKGRDILGIAQTGTGKTAAFALPILQRLSAVDNRRLRPKSMRTLVLTPTRELAGQIEEGFATYGRHVALRNTVIFGGVGQFPQVKAMSRGVDILVATPGRLLDLINQGHVTLDAVEIFVLDEADRMLDMGFIHDVKKLIAKLPKARQTMLFSATMPDAVADLAHGLLQGEHARVEVTPVASTVERIAQKVLFVDSDDKRHLLVDVLKDAGRAIIFTRTKHGANRLAEQLQKSGIGADAIHGNKSQTARQRALDDFRNGKLRALVATDIAARGIDIDGITHVINFDLPNEPESYVHRIGRTARAGAHGIALSFCQHDELLYLKQIEKTIRQSVPVDADHAWHAAETANLFVSGGKLPKPPPQGGNRGQRSPRPGKPAQEAGQHPGRSGNKERHAAHASAPQRPKKPHHRGQTPKGAPGASASAAQLPSALIGPRKSATR